MTEKKENILSSCVACGGGVVMGPRVKCQWVLKIITDDDPLDGEFRSNQVLGSILDHWMV